jgi:hypothetical protein
VSNSRNVPTQTPPEILPGVGSTMPGPYEGELQINANSIGYGTDPNVVTPKSTWPRTLTLYDRHFLAALSDIILPAHGREPAPSEIGIDDFFDDWLSAPYNQQIADRSQILSGLDLVNDVALRLFGADFLTVSNVRKREIIDEIIKAEGEGRAFFVRIRYLVVGAYFTSDVGMRAIGYRGNIPLRQAAHVSNDAKRIIERELRKLGL